MGVRRHAVGMSLLLFRNLPEFRVVILLAVAALAFAHSGRQSHHEDRLVIGMELAYPPFEMADEKGEPAGVSVYLAKALGTALHRPVKIENLPFDGLIPSLKMGRST